MARAAVVRKARINFIEETCGWFNSVILRNKSRAKLSLLDGAIKARAEIRGGEVDENGGQGGDDDIGQAGPVQEIGGSLDRSAIAQCVVDLELEIGVGARSEERRVGKEGRSGWAAQEDRRRKELW